MNSKQSKSLIIEEDHKPRTKKPYMPPTLILYGKLIELTAAGISGKGETGNQGHSKKP